MHEQTIPAFNTREDLQVNLSILSPKLGIIPAGKRDWWQLKGENLTFRYSVHIISSVTDKKTIPILTCYSNLFQTGKDQSDIE